MEQITESRTKIILDSIADGVFTVDSDWNITSFNRAAEDITGIDKSEATGRKCWEVFRASICESACSLRHTFETGKPVVNRSIFIVNSKSERVPVSISTALLRDKTGKIIGGVETFRDISVVEALRKELSGKHSFHDIISKDKEMGRLFGILEQVSDTETNVLLEGESGTGKELFAKAIHSMSRRSKGPMITINCGALPDNLLESELFGYKAGAFTDARKDKPGRIRLAHKGTLFLDEIGDISPALQVRLLRVIQERTYEPLGSTMTEKAEVRIITATNKNLETLVSRGIFREDLYYRINVVKIGLPPLRERKSDIPLLADFFIRKYNRLNGKNIQGFKPEVMPVLMSHDFPGNVRELENILEYSIVVCKDILIGIQNLPDYLQKSFKSAETPNAVAGTGKNMKEIERDFILNTLSANNWSRKEAAKQMGIHPSTLWRKIKSLDIDLSEKDGRTVQRSKV